MKKLTNFLIKVNLKLTDGEPKKFWKRVLGFYILMLLIYLWLVFAGMLSTPKFAYAEF